MVDTRIKLRTLPSAHPFPSWGGLTDHTEGPPVTAESVALASDDFGCWVSVWGVSMGWGVEEGTYPCTSWFWYSVSAYVL
jgi:hypothetical protein